MDAYGLLSDFRARGIRLIPNPPRLTVEPASRLTDVDRAAIRAAKSELLRLLVADGFHDHEEDEIDRVARDDGWRPPTEIPPAIAAKIKCIEPRALALGWSPGRLWNFAFWPHRHDEPRGLASVINEGDRIVEVFADHIVIEKNDIRKVRQTFV